MYTAAFGEYLGTCLLVGALAFTTNPIFVVAALAIAIGLIGKISGGYFNPALVLWAFASGKLSQQKTVSYLIAEFGAALTVWVAHSMIKV